LVRAVAELVGRTVTSTRRGVTP
ncbi:MAG: hypothetical protein RL685_5002, partial [Pseudomonadota bacterium]